MTNDFNSSPSYGAMLQEIKRLRYEVDTLLDIDPSLIVQLWSKAGRVPTYEEKRKYRAQYERYIAS